MITLLAGDCRDVLATLPAQLVQTIVTSPPYYGLRKYTDDPKEIGQDPTPAAYVAALVAVFAACWRVLRDDGTLWLNLGDSYAMNGTPGMSNLAELGMQYRGGGHKRDDVEKPSRRAPSGIPPKNLLGMPWRVAFALQDAGWILRSDIIWNKPNPMPESVRDRPTRAHEYLFLFAKRPRYYYDATAIAEPSIGGDPRKPYAPGQVDMRGNGHDRNGGSERSSSDAGITRNRRSVWTIATQPYAGAHFATMPEALIEPCILAGSAAQACETCGAAWTRVVEHGTPERIGGNAGVSIGHADGPMNRGGNGQWDEGHMPMVRPITTRGFAPRCQCETNTGAARSIVLDPFGGSGTVARVAERHQRDSILIDLNPAYIDLQEERTNGVQVEMQLC